MEAADYTLGPGRFRIVTEGGRIRAIHWLEPDAAPMEQCTALSDRAAAELADYFAGSRQAFDLPLAPAGTAFQQQVWQQMQAIPYGQTRTYGELARALGKPGAARAVGQAANRNPIAIVIPCHRVLGAGGALVGYTAGLPRKRLLLELEQRETAGN